MPRRKKQRIGELAGMPHVFVWPEESPELRDFALCRPLVLDLGCGRGDTTVAMAELDPERHYLGVDLKGARLHRGAEVARQSGLANVAFAVHTVLELDRLLPEQVCVEGWLLFPDPYPKQRASKHRLISPGYLEVYRRLMRRGARIHLKTDSPLLFEYGLRTLRRQGCMVHDVVRDLPPSAESGCLRAVQSAYETRFRQEGRAIHYLSFEVH